jgi:hypothetical protein
MKARMLATAIVLMAVHSHAQPQGYILFSVRLSPNGSVLYELPVAGGSARTVVSTPSVTHYTSPDAPPFLGSEFLVAFGTPGSSYLYVMDSTGGVVRTAIAAGFLNIVDDPAASFDGTRIAYVDRSNITRLCVGNYDGTGFSTVYTTAYGTVTVYDPCFTPDGHTLCFTLRDYNVHTQYLYTVPVPGGAAQRVPNAPEGAEHPAYSPDGRWLAYVAPAAGMTQLFVAASDGSAARQVTFPPENAVYPSFSPDSRYIVAGSFDGLIIIDLSNDTVIRRIPTGGALLSGTTWHLGAKPSAGTIVKAKAKSRKLLVKTGDLVPSALPAYALIVIDGVSLPLEGAQLWQNKNNKKYLYRDKNSKRKAKVVLKNGKGAFVAKRLELVAGEDYQVDVDVPVGVNIGDESIVGVIRLDRKGGYKAPK